MTLLDLIFPKHCVGCGAEGVWLCRICTDSLSVPKAPSCADCGRLTEDSRYCKNHRPKHEIVGLHFVGSFKPGPLREAVHELKYNGVTELSRPLGKLLASRLTEGKWANFLVIPIPLHGSRLAERGFNQSELLSKVLGLPYRSDVLVRTRKTLPQATLDDEKRRSNVTDAFAVTVASASAVRGRSILLVDDVSTTGSTLDAAAQTLRRAGARTVWGAVIAKG